MKDYDIADQRYGCSWMEHVKIETSVRMWNQRTVEGIDDRPSVVARVILFTAAQDIGNDRIFKATIASRLQFGIRNNLPQNMRGSATSLSYKPWLF
jgi:hypothetical protein